MFSLIIFSGFVRTYYAGLFSCLLFKLLSFPDFFYHILRFALEHCQICFRCIMFVFHSRCFGYIMICFYLRHCFRRDYFIHGNSSYFLFQHFLRNISRSENHRRFCRHINNRGFNADTDFSSIDNHIYSSVHVFSDVFSPGWTRSAGCIGTRCCNQHTGLPD